MTQVLWLTVEQNPAASKAPKWKRTFGSVDGKVAFVPAWVSGYEGSTVLMCASFDGARVVGRNGKMYFDVDWMAREYPKSVGAIKNAQESLNEYLDRSNKNEH